MRTCSVDGCENKHYGLGYCRKHYQQYRRYGYIPARTRNDANEIIEYDDYAEVVLYNKDGNEVARTMIDLEHVDTVKNYRWHLSHGYARNDEVGFLHRYIMNLTDDLVIDHINRNPLDNRRDNLRICTQHENCFNRLVSNRNTGKVIGVEKRSNKWIAYINYNYRKIHLGCYNTIEEAIEARRQAEIEYFGEFAPNN